MLSNSDLRQDGELWGPYLTPPVTEEVLTPLVTPAYFSLTVVS